MGDAILDRDLKVEWLDAALRVARKRLPLAEARTQLRDELVHEPLGPAALTKTVTALTRIWLAPSTLHASHAQWALAYADQNADWRPLHLGAMLVGESFIRTLLDACGREVIARGEVVPWCCAIECEGSTGLDGASTSRRNEESRPCAAWGYSRANRRLR